MNFHRHVKSVCSTVVWRACVHFHSHVGSVCISSFLWGVCGHFPFNIKLQHMQTSLYVHIYITRVYCMYTEKI